MEKKKKKSLKKIGKYEKGNIEKSHKNVGD